MADEQEGQDTKYSADNPFAPKKPTSAYSPDNPFAKPAPAAAAPAPVTTAPSAPGDVDMTRPAGHEVVPAITDENDPVYKASLAAARKHAPPGTVAPAPVAPAPRLGALATFGRGMTQSGKASLESSKGTAEMIAAPVVSAATAGLYLGQKSNEGALGTGPTSKGEDASGVRADNSDANDLLAAAGVPRISDRDAALSAAQLAALGYGRYLGKFLGKLTASGLDAAIAKAGGSKILAKAPDAVRRVASAVAEMQQPTAGQAIGNTLAHTVEGGTIGASYDPEHPARGAAIGAGLGIVGNEMLSADVRKLRGEPEPKPLAEEGRLANPTPSRARQVNPIVPTEPEVEYGATNTPEQAAAEVKRQRGQPATDDDMSLDARLERARTRKTAQQNTGVTPPSMEAPVAPAITPDVTASVVSGVTPPVAPEVPPAPPVAPPPAAPPVAAAVTPPVAPPVTTPEYSADNPFAKTDHTPTSIASTAEALRAKSPQVADILDAVRYRIDNFAHTNPSDKPMSWHEAMDALEEDDFARDNEFTPAQFAEARRALNESRPTVKAPEPSKQLPKLNIAPKNPKEALEMASESLESDHEAAPTRDEDEMPAEKKEAPAAAEKPKLSLTKPKREATFAATYERELRAEMAKNPSKFAYGPEEVPRVVSKMMKALSEGSANFRDSNALKRAAKLHGAPFTTLGLKRAAQQAPEAPKEEITAAHIATWQRELDEAEEHLRTKQYRLTRRPIEPKELKKIEKRRDLLKERVAAGPTVAAPAPKPTLMSKEPPGGFTEADKVPQAANDATRARMQEKNTTPADPASPEFKKWFGESKVVDASGKPLIVYHGTRKQFTSFRTGTAAGWGSGIYFTDNQQQATEEYGDGPGGRVIAAYVSLQNPYREQTIPDETLERTQAWKDIADTFRGGDVSDAWHENGAFVGKVLRELGYDGVIAKNSNDIRGQEIVAFSPDQVREVGGAAEKPAAIDTSKLPTHPDLPKELDTPEVRALRAKMASMPGPTGTAEDKQFEAEQVAKMVATAKSQGIEQPEFHYIMGITGAGKTTVLTNPLIAETGGGRADADDVKEASPYYADGMGAKVLHPQSSDVRARATKRLVAQQSHIVYPTIGDPVNTLAQAKELQRLGYTVHLHLIDLPALDAAKRVYKRFTDGSGHFVDPVDTLTIGDRPRRAFAALADLPGVIVHDPLDNTVPRGTAPRVVRHWRDEWGFPVPAADAGGPGHRADADGVAQADAQPPEGQVADATGNLRTGVPDESRGEPASGVQPREAGGNTPSGRAERGTASPSPVRERAGGAPEKASGTSGLPEPRRTSHESRVDGEGAGDGRGGRSPAERAGRDAGRVRGSNYELTPGEADNLLRGGMATKAKSNVAAIELLKQIEAEQRPATRDEQEALSKYVGWGGLPHVFDPGHKQYAASVGPRLKELLTPEEWDAARASTPNAHYTSPEVIAAVHTLLARLGFTGGRILEPSMGAGYFLGMTPSALRREYQWLGVELDSVTGRIGKLLYPESDIRVQGFQDLQIPDGYMDAAAGNVPFGNYKVHDPRYNALKLSIHNYFFRKTLDLVRPGGVIAYITSAFTMDGKDPSVRNALAEHAELLGAIRLPGDAFKGIANTEVTTDLIVLQRKGEGVKSGHPWSATVPTSVPGKTGATSIALNEYFAAHPENILGELRGDGTMNAKFGGEAEMTVRSTGDLAPQLADAVSRFEAGSYVPREVTSPASKTLTEMPVIFAPETVRDYGYTVKGGTIMQRRAGILVDAGVPKSAVARVTKLIGLRDLAKSALNAQIEDRPEAEIAKTRKALEKAYTAFVKEHGPILKEVRLETKRLNPTTGEPVVQVRTPNLQHFEDGERALVTALEHYDPETGTSEKGDLLVRRVYEPRKAAERADTPSDALPMVLAEMGKVDLPRIAQLSGVSQEDARQALRGQIFEDPATPGRWEHVDAYTSGDVKTKLAQLQDAAKKDPARWAENVKALEAAIPADLPPSKISVRLGAPWVPATDIQQFVRDVLGDGGVNVSYTPAGNVGWKVDADWRVKNAVGATTEFGTRERNAVDLLEEALNQKTPTVYFPPDSDGRRAKNPDATLAAQEKQQKLKDRFEAWVWEEPKRADRLAAMYNDRFNRIRNTEFDGSHLTLPGSAAYIKGRVFALRPHQKNAIWRIITSGNTLLAHVVGSGKTYTMIAAGMEEKRLGLIRKPVYVVPNHMLDQFSTEFKQLYPAADLLLATKDDFAKEERQAFVARAATNNWDAIVMTHRSFESIPMSDEFQRRYIQQQLDELEGAIRDAKAAKGDRATIKQIEKAKLGLEAKLDGLMAEGKKDQVLSFEQMGIDHAFVDEADAYKNLLFSTKLEGVAAPASQKAFDMLMKSIHLESVNPGRGLVFATGTPIANAVAEMYTMQRYLQPKLLAARGLSNFDAWAGTFGRTVTGMEMKPDNSGFRLKTRFASYDNVGELAQMFRAVTDVKTAEDLELPRPKLKGGAMQIVTAPTSGPLKAYVKDLARRGELVQSRKVEPDVDNWLKITSDGRRAALDMRLVDANALDLPDSKLNMAVDNIHALWESTKALKGAQLVFSDLSTPGSDPASQGGLSGFNVYDDIKQKLVAKGVPAKEVRFIHDAKTDEAKKKLFGDVRAGRVRVLIGSTEKMGAGTNVQDRLVALHNLDAPWRPRDIEQRHGRILRQGNQLFDGGKIPHVEIHTYITEGSFDGYIWQNLERKAGFIKLALTADASTRSIEDAGEVQIDWATAKAIASGNPKVKEKAEVDAQVQKLERMERTHRDEEFAVRKELASLPAKIDGDRAAVEKGQADVARIQPTSGDHFTITLGGSTITKRVDAGVALQAEVQKGYQAGLRLPKGDDYNATLGKYAGFDVGLNVHRGAITGLPEVYLKLIGADQHFREVGENDSPASLLAQLDAMPALITKQVEGAAARLASNEKRLATLRERGSAGFPKAKQLAELRTRQADLDKELAKDAEQKDDPGTPTVAMGFADPFTALAYTAYKSKVGQATIAKAAQKVTIANNAIKSVWNASAMSPDAGVASRIFRPARADMEREVARAREAIAQTRAALDKLEPGPLFDGPRWQAYREMEEGIVPKDADMRSLWKTLRSIQDAARDAVHALGPGHLEHFIDDYMARVYVPLTGAKQKAALRMYGARRPMEGKKGFKKSRQHVGLEDSIAGALAKGLGPPTDNPLDMVVLKIMEMRKYLMAHRIKQELKGEGLIKYKKVSRKMPDGYAKLDDRIFTVHAPRGAEGEVRVRGEYVAPIDVARVINNSLSPGLRGKPLYDAYAGLANVLNMVQLGVSAFHAGFVAFDATVQTAATGLDQLLTGKGPGGRLAGAGKLSLAAASAATGPLTVLPLPAAVASYLKGRQVWHAYFNDAQSKEMQQVIDGLIAGGGRAKMDDYYRVNAITRLRSALRDKRWAAVGLNAPFAALEGTMYPLLEHVVPRMKLGAIYHMMQAEMGKLPANATDDQVRKTAAKVVDAVDARLGQMIYDNRFWHRVTKEIMMMGVRSVGWDVGTFDVTLGGAAQGLGNAKDLLSGKRPESWHKVQYLAMLAGVVALYGAVYTYLHTGKGPADYKDLYFPRTGSTNREGNPDRITPPTYMKDIFGMQRHPVNTVMHKLHPLLNTAAEALQNKNFYGDEIVNADAPLSAKARQIMGFVVKDVLTPFSVRNAMELGKRGAGTREKVEGFLGNQAAPREVERTPAQNKMAEYLARRGHPLRTPEQKAAAEERYDVTQELREGMIGKDSVIRLMRAGELTRRQAISTITSAKKDPLVARFRMLSPEEAQAVYDLGTPAEQALWEKDLRRKVRRLPRLKSSSTK